MLAWGALSMQIGLPESDATPYKPELSPRVQVPNNHILSKILTYITIILLGV